MNILNFSKSLCRNDLIEKIISKLVRSKEDFLELFEKRGVYICYINLGNYLLYRNSQIIDYLTHLYIDTMSMALLLSFVINRKIERLSFDINMLAKDLFEYCIANNKTIFFAGGKEDEIEIFIKKIKKAYPELNIRGYINGYTSDEKIIKTWKDKGKSDFFVVGLGNVKQEFFISRLAKEKEEVFCIACGAFISQTAKSFSLHYYPNLIYKMHLRWCYRLIKEKRILIRFLKNYPKSFWTLILDYRNWKKQKGFKKLCK